MRIAMTLVAGLLTILLAACGGEVGISNVDVGQDQDGEEGLVTVKERDRDEGGLERLGVDITQSDRKNPYGEPLPPNYNPLSKKHRTLAPLSELYFTGLTVNDRRQGLLDDGTQGYAELYSDSDDSWTKLQHISGKGDVDGDGFDEIVVAYYVTNDKEIKIRVIDRNEDNTFSTTKVTVASDVEVTSKFMALSTGDLDSDGLDEIAVTADETLYIVDDMKADLALVNFKDYSSTNPDNHTRVLSLGIGDFNGDGTDQLYVVHSQPGESMSEGHSTFYLYSGALTEELDSGLLLHTAGNKTHVITFARIAVGDIDGDKLDEIVVSAMSDKGGMLIFAIDDQMNNKAITATHADAGVLTLISFGLTLPDVDGDATKEIFTGQDLLRYDASKDAFSSIAQIPNPFVTFSAAGDMDGDRKEDLVLFWAMPFGAPSMGITIWGMDETSTLVVKETLPAALSDISTVPTLVCANVDDDSLVVEYTGRTELHFSKPHIIAVMAAPPYHEGIGQNVEGSGTTFGRSKSLETEASASVGLSVGFSIGAKAGFKLFGNGVEVETKRTFKASMDWTATASASYETTVSYSSGPGEDKVVFSSVPFDVYYYRVVSSPDSSAVGETITINLPREPQTFSVSRTYYNANNGDYMDIDQDILSHTIGDPRSYPTADQMKAATTYGILPIGFVNPDCVTVGQGSGVQTMTIDTSAGLGLGVEMEFSSETEAEVTAGPVVVGGSVELRLGVGLSVTASQGLFIEGVIGDIPEESYTGDRLYKAGIYAYPRTASNGQSFLVINYWVD